MGTRHVRAVRPAGSVAARGQVSRALAAMVPRGLWRLAAAPGDAMNATVVRFARSPDGMREVLIDASDAALFDRHKWHVLSGKYVYRSFRTCGGRKSVYLHRALTDAPPNLDVDHVNRNTFDNRRRNLRVCRHAENARNSKVPVTNTTGSKGVYRRPSITRQWVAEIVVDGKKIWLGSHNTIDQAIAARVEAARKLHGEFARTG